MLGSSTRTCTLFVGCACALAIAVAVPATGGAHRQRARHAGKCREPSAAHHHARRGARCRAARRTDTRRFSPAAKAHGKATSPEGRRAAGTTTSGAALSPPGAVQDPAAETTAPPRTPPSVPRVQVTAVEYSYALSRTTVPAGKVIIEFVNHGQDEHNLNVALGEGSLAGWFASTPAKGVRDQAFELRPGTYTLFCSLAEHEQKGMKATLVVE
jgi:plastocyanin